MSRAISPMALSLLALPGLMAFPVASDANVQVHAFQNSASTANGTIRGTGLRVNWLAYPGLSLGGDWYLRPGAELSYGRFQGGFEDRRYWEGTALSRAEFRGDSVGFYLQGGLGTLQMSGEYRDGTGSTAGVFEDNDRISHAEIGISLREGVRMDLGFRYQRYHDSDITFRGLVVGLGL